MEDIQVEYDPELIRVTLKGKVLQLVLLERIKCSKDSVSVERSSGTGLVKIRMTKEGAQNVRFFNITIATSKFRPENSKTSS